MALADGDKTCSCGKGCLSFGACLRGKNITNTFERRSVSTRGVLRSYAAARAEGLQPDAVSPSAVDHAKRESDRTGTAYRGD